MFRVRVLTLMACIGSSLATLACPPIARADGLKVGGTGSANEIMSRVGRAWSADARGVGVEVIPGLGSSGAIAAVADGVLDMAVSGRALKDEEREKGLIAVVFAKTPFVMATSYSDAGSLKSTALPDFYSSPNAAWANGTPVKPVIRPKSESDTLLLTSLFPKMADALGSLRARGDVPIAATDHDNLDLAERVPGSLVATSYAQIMNEKRKLRIVPIDDIAPSLETAEAGTYPYFKVFYLVTKKDRPPVLDTFIAYLKSSDGIAALRAAGALSVDH